MFPGRKLTGIFQPHLYSRTRDFATEFAAQLDRLDEVILLDIYPAREQPIPGVSSRVIFDQLKSGAKQLVGKEKLPEIVKQVEPGVILMMGAGDIATMVEPIKNSLQEITHV